VLTSCSPYAHLHHGFEYATAVVRRVVARSQHASIPVLVETPPLCVLHLIDRFCWQPPFQFLARNVLQTLALLLSVLILPPSMPFKRGLDQLETLALARSARARANGYRPNAHHEADATDVRPYAESSLAKRQHALDTYCTAGNALSGTRVRKRAERTLLGH